MATPAGRLAYLDTLKIIAICFVVVIHLIGHKVAVFENSFSWFVANFFSSTARFAVPVFVMCSGAVFLGRSTENSSDIRAFYRKYMPVYLGYTFLGLLVAKTLSLYIGQEIFILEGLIYNFYTSFGSGMWFFFMFLGLILVTPILQLITKRKDIELLFLGLWFYFSVFSPLFVNIFDLYDQYIPNMLFSSFFVGYFVLGHYCSSLQIKIKNSILIGCGLGSLFLSSISSYLVNVGATSFNEFFYYGNNPFVFVYTVCMFLLVRNLFSGKRSSWVLWKVSTATVYVYIFHTFVQSVVSIGYSENIFVIMFYRVPVILIITFIVSFIYMFLFSFVKTTFTGYVFTAKTRSYNFFNWLYCRLKGSISSGVFGR